MYKRKLLSVSFLLMLGGIFGYARAQAVTLPYMCDFESDTENAEWQFLTRPRATPFTIGYAARRNGQRALYLSNDEGRNIGYTSTPTGYVSVAYRKFTFTKGDYDLVYDLRAAAGLQKDSIMVAYFPTATKPSSTATGREWPKEAKANAFVDDDRISVYGTTTWKSVSGTMSIPSDGDYYLAFYFKESGGTGSELQPGVIVDNIQINIKKDPLDCAAMPRDLKAVKTSNTVDLSWKGNATSYDIRYFSSHSKYVNNIYDVKGVTATSYSFQISSLPEGNYTFQVRSNCPGDTSLWVGIDNMFVYDPSLHCVDYLNLDDPSVVCTSGTFADPYQTTGKVDYGPTSKFSLHTIHSNGDEYDPLTGFGLKTVPEGSVASVRLCGWQETIVPAGSITYDYNVTDEAKVLLVKYAAVLQYEQGHSETHQTRIKVEILDQKGRLLGDCMKSDYNAKQVSNDQTRGWHKYLPIEGQCQLANPIMWSDWFTLGLNLSSYVGQKLKIRLTMLPCFFDYHFAYCYFAFDCTNGDIEGMSCGEVPTQFVVSEGFDYRWYKMSDPTKESVCDKNIFVPEPGDTCSYYVDLIHPENENCYFTLNAYTLPIMPRAKPDYRLVPKGCVNIVELVDTGGVYKLPSGKPEELTPDTITARHWDLGEYGESTDKTVRIVVPNEGDTFNIKLRSEFNGCEDIRELTVYAPAIGTVYDTVSAYFCAGKYIDVNGKRYDKPGTYQDVLSSKYSGCDSVLTINVDVLVADTIRQDTTICSDYPLDFFGQTLSESGRYTHSVPSSMGCDTLFYIMDLTVSSSLHLTFDENPDICADDTAFTVPFTVTEGIPTAVSVSFDDASHAAGFEDVDSIACERDHFKLKMPSDVKPGVYKANVLFYNANCDNLETEWAFTVKYPSSIIAQRWNDVLGVTKGDYEFVSFQWFLDGAPIEGAIGANYYTPDKLKFDGNYSVLLTRNDGVTIYTCSYRPQEFASSECVDVINVTIAGTPIEAKMPRQAVAEIYSVSGVKLATQHLEEGYNSIAMPAQSGVYLLLITYPDGRRDYEKVVVK